MRSLGVLALVALAATSSSQIFATRFVRSNVQSGVNFSKGVDLANGNYAIVVDSAAGSVLYIIRGSQVLSATLLKINGISARVRDISADPSGNIFTVGEYNDTASSRQVALHKFGIGGNLIWQRSFNPGNQAYESARGAVCDPFGNLIIIGHSGPNPFPSGSEVAWVSRLRPNGAVSFDTDLNGVLTQGRTVCVADNGSIHASSYTNFQSYYFRLDGVTGAVQHTDDLPPNSFCENIISDGNQVFLAGVGEPPSFSQRPMLMANNVITGATNWVNFVTSPSVSGGIFQSVLIDGSGAPVAAGDMVDGAEVGMVTKFNPANGNIVWHRKVGNSSQQRSYAGFRIDRWNESILQTRILDGGNSFVRIDAIGPTGSVRGGITIPTSSPADNIPHNLIYQPTHGRGLSLGAYGGATNSRWIGFERAPVAINDSYSTVRNTVLNANTVNGNDRYWDGGVTALNTSPSDGGIVFNTNGTFVYTPDNDFVGPDSFTYRQTRAGMPPSIATVNIMVNP